MAPPPAKPPAARKRTRKRKRRAVSSSSSSSSDASSSDSEAPNQAVVRVPVKAAKKQQPEPSEAPSSSDSSSESDSDSGNDSAAEPTRELSPEAASEAAPQQAARRSLSPTPPPAPIPPFLPPKGTAGSGQQDEQILKERFRKFWMASVADAFKDDLEEIRKEPNMTKSKLAMLIDSLAAGGDVLASSQGPDGDTSEMQIGSTNTLAFYPSLGASKCSSISHLVLEGALSFVKKTVAIDPSDSEVLGQLKPYEVLSTSRKISLSC